MKKKAVKRPRKAKEYGVYEMDGFTGSLREHAERIGVQYKPFSNCVYRQLNKCIHPDKALKIAAEWAKKKRPLDF